MKDKDIYNQYQAREAEPDNAPYIEEVTLTTSSQTLSRTPPITGTSSKSPTLSSSRTRSATTSLGSSRTPTADETRTISASASGTSSKSPSGTSSALETLSGTVSGTVSGSASATPTMSPQAIKDGSGGLSRVELGSIAGGVGGAIVLIAVFLARMFRGRKATRPAQESSLGSRVTMDNPMRATVDFSASAVQVAASPPLSASMPAAVDSSASAVQVAVSSTLPVSTTTAATVTPSPRMATYQASALPATNLPRTNLPRFY